MRTRLLCLLCASSVKETWQCTILTGVPGKVSWIKGRLVWEILGILITDTVSSSREMRALSLVLTKTGNSPHTVFCSQTTKAFDLGTTMSGPVLDSVWAACSSSKQGARHVHGEDFWDYSRVKNVYYPGVAKQLWGTQAERVFVAVTCHTGRSNI